MMNGPPGTRPTPSTYGSANWAREIGVREPVRFESVEVLRNLPPSWAAGLTQTT